MFYAIREVMDQEGTPTGEFWVSMSFDPDVMPLGGIQSTYPSIEEAKAHYDMVEWRYPDPESPGDIAMIAED